jgi:hypothetical protein
MNTHIFILHLVDTHPDLIADDLKFSNIHNPTQPRGNNDAGCLSKTWINNFFIFGWDQSWVN